MLQDLYHPDPAPADWYHSMLFRQACSRSRPRLQQHLKPVTILMPFNTPELVFFDLFAALVNFSFLSVISRVTSANHHLRLHVPPRSPEEPDLHHPATTSNLRSVPAFERHRPPARPG